MTEDAAISWRGVYMKLLAFSLSAATLLTILAFATKKTNPCTHWFHCSYYFTRESIDQPFGNPELAYVLNADLVLWGVLMLMFVMWLWRGLTGVRRTGGV